MGTKELNEFDKVRSSTWSHMQLEECYPLFVIKHFDRGRCKIGTFCTLFVFDFFIVFEFSVVIYNIFKLFNEVLITEKLVSLFVYNIHYALRYRGIVRV